MYDFRPYFTNDGSVGLYSKDFDDIYHSSTGALTEAYEKFILPIDTEWLLSKNEIKILDICYGIGYNTKSFLNFIFENIFLKKNKKFFCHANHSIAPIYTNNNRASTNHIYNGALYTDNIFGKISVTAIDNDKNLYLLSPFIKTGEHNFTNDNLTLEHKNIKKYLSQKKIKNFRKINNLINFLIFEKIAQNAMEDLYNSEILDILYDKRNKSYFERDILGIFDFYRYLGDKLHLKNKIKAFLHNIYYRYVTARYKKGLKAYKLDDFNFEYKCDDARNAIKNDTKLYNLVFLDAFTPSKCPCLWSYEFFKLLFERLEPDGLILTYSTSAAIRGAMIEAGFAIGNIYNKRLDKFTGTIATKNPALIKHPLSEFDLGLLKTSAGIFYRDKYLTGQNEAIRALRNEEVKNTTRMSTSQYKKSILSKEDKCSTT